MIQLVIFDFDGVFNDGKIYFDSTKEIIKHYNVKDGMGIKLLKDTKIKIGCISGFKKNNSQLCILKHLKFDYIYLEAKNKLEILNNICQELNITFDNVAYIGDDINDIEILERVRYSGCPLDAVNKVRNICNFISTKKGGEGCVREFCEYIIETNNPIVDTNVISEIKNEFNYQINNFDINQIDSFISLLKKKNNIFFAGIGKSGNIAKHCSDLLKCISFPSFYFDLLNCNHGDIGLLRKNDIIIFFSNSGNTREIIEIIPLFKKKQIMTIGVCCNNDSLFSKNLNHTIVIPYQKEISGIKVNFSE